jgi:hypothetical protein
MDSMRKLWCFAMRFDGLTAVKILSVFICEYVAKPKGGKVGFRVLMGAPFWPLATPLVLLSKSSVDLSWKRIN